MNETDKTIVELARSVLDDKAAGLDAASASRLNRIRQQALDHARRPRRRWLPAGLLTAATALALTLAVLLRPPLPSGEEPAPLEDLDLLASSESLEMLEDLEFYLWLEGELEKG